MPIPSPPLGAVDLLRGLLHDLFAQTRAKGLGNCIGEEDLAAVVIKLNDMYSSNMYLPTEDGDEICLYMPKESDTRYPPGDIASQPGPSPQRI